MIICDFHIRRTERCPAKADAELVVHAETMLSSAVAPQRFQPIARRNTKIMKHTGNLQLPKLTPSDRFDVHEPFARYPFAKSSVSAFLNETITLGIIARRVMVGNLKP
jgi:hypothetical protein